MVQKDSLKKNIIIIGGPTASGKTSLAIELALKFNGEVVSADSMQIYKELNIGTGKVTKSETRGVTHHMIDILSPDEQYSVGQYLQDVKNVIAEIHDKNKLPIIAGGTGLYINALINGLNFSDADKSETVREKWKQLASQNGNRFVYDYLKKIDPLSASKININDLKRIIRAIEIYEVTGKTKSESVTVSECPYDYLFFIIDRSREQLYEAINNRVDYMFENGLYEEALKLEKFKHCQSMQAIGYKQIFEFAEGKFSDLETVKRTVKQLTRNYAKRQMTFFKGMNAEKIWLNSDDDFKNIYQTINNFLR